MDGYTPRLSERARRWLRLGGLLVALVLACGLAYRLRGVFTPLLVAAALAYVLNPIVTWLEVKRRVPRLATVIVAFAALTALLVCGGVYLAGTIGRQAIELQESLPAYVQEIGQWLATLQGPLEGRGPTDSAPSHRLATAEAPDLAAWWRQIAPWIEEHGVAAVRSTATGVRAAFSGLTNMLALLVLIPIFTFYFLWRFDAGVRIIREHLPAALRPQIVHYASLIDHAVARFFRGRLIVCLIMGALMSIGWAFVGVPYSFLLGLLGGALTLVPFLSLLSLPPALLFTFMAASNAGEPWVGSVIAAIGVYMGVQAVESFVLSPLIEGPAAGLHPLAIVVALLIGAELAGLLGMLLAIPLASTLKVVFAESVVPELRRLASAEEAAAPAPGPASEPAPAARTDTSGRS